MPELPEVETIARGLRPELAGRRIARVELRWPGTVKSDPHTFAARVTAAPITGVARRGKLLTIHFANDSILAVHLRMTGRLFLPEAGQEPTPHTHTLFTLDNGRLLTWEDTRKFGSLQHFPPGEIETWPFYATLGPEPLEIKDHAFVALLAPRNARIKSLLLDQHVIAGIGNIYADESLFRARIHPATPANRIPRAKLAALHTHLQAVLREAIDACGSSISDYRDARGNVGAFQNKFQAYGRASQPCPHCHTPMQSTKVSGRTSTFCPKCQR